MISDEQLDALAQLSLEVRTVGGIYEPRLRAFDEKPLAHWRADLADFVADFRALRAELEKQRARADRLEAEAEKLDEELAAVLPEDCGPVEYIKTLEKTLAEQRARAEGLETELADMRANRTSEHVSWCAWCGARSESSTLEELKAHVSACPKHPMAALRAALEESRGALALDVRVENFDCPHDAEHRCHCGTTHSDLVRRQIAARDSALEHIQRLLGVPPGVTGLVTNPELLRAHRGIELLRDSVRLFHSATCAGVENKCHACEPTSSDVFLERQIGPPGVTTTKEGPTNE